MSPYHASLLIIATVALLVNHRILFRLPLRLPRSGSHGKVVAVVDGDTIDVQIGGKVQRVRYIGINAPERGQTGHEEATERNRQLVMDKWVKLEADKRDEDQYGRKLRYVWVGRKLVNRELYRDGVVEIMQLAPNLRRIGEIEA